MAIYAGSRACFAAAAPSHCPRLSTPAQGHHNFEAVNNGQMASVPGHPFWDHVIALLKHRRGEVAHTRHDGWVGGWVRPQCTSSGMNNAAPSHVLCGLCYNRCRSSRLPLLPGSRPLYMCAQLTAIPCECCTLPLAEQAQEQGILAVLNGTGPLLLRDSVLSYFNITLGEPPHPWVHWAVHSRPRLAGLQGGQLLD